MPGRLKIRLVTADPRTVAGGPSAAGCVETAGDEALVFCYMDGVLAADPACCPAASSRWADWAARGAALKLCRSAWERRRSGPPAAPYELASLTDLALAAEKAAAIECIGGGPQPAPGTPPPAGREDGTIGLLVGTDPVYDPYGEIVDLALAIALLDLPLDVVFRGRGLFHLSEIDAETAGRWRTLRELTAARLYGAADDAERYAFGPRPAAVGWLAAGGIDDVLSGCRLLLTP